VQGSDAWLPVVGTLWPAPRNWSALDQGCFTKPSSEPIGGGLGTDLSDKKKKKSLRCKKQKLVKNRHEVLLQRSPAQLMMTMLWRLQKPGAVARSLFPKGTQSWRQVLG